MNKAFVFDMDGVLIDSESNWAPIERRVLPQLFGETIARQIGSSLGLSLHDFYDSAVHLGATISRDEFIEAYERESADVYANSPITDGVEELGGYLLKHDFKIGLVSMSPQKWIDLTLAKISFRDQFGIVLSLDQHPFLRGKPSPDGYKKAMEVLGAGPTTSMILEDSNAGLRAAKDSGAYTIGFRGHIPQGYQQVGADVYADSMTDVMRLVGEFESKINK